MLLQPFFAAHCSAARNNCAPAPRLRWCSSTTNPFTSARKSTSSSGVTLTCSQPVTFFPVSTTKIACSAAGRIRFILCTISARLAGYPSCPLSSANRSASCNRARRIRPAFTSQLLVGIEEDCDRPFIHQLHGHHRLKNSRAHVDSHFSQRLPKFFIERFLQLRR